MPSGAMIRAAVENLTGGLSDIQQIPLQDTKLASYPYAIMMKAAHCNVSQVHHQECPDLMPCGLSSISFLKLSSIYITRM